MRYKHLIPLIVCLAVLLALTGCGRNPASVKDNPAATAPADTLPPVTTPPDGNPNDVTCQGTYSVDGDGAAAAADAVVATMGDAALTNEQLWVYYWLEVAAYRQAGHENGPDFAQDLDTQLCSLDSRAISWQQYFLESALNTWSRHQALVLMGEEEGVPTEEEYKPDLEKRKEYMTGMPATAYLYAWNESYTPNRLHQTYLDAIPDTLQSLAANTGFASTDALAAAMAGAGSDALTHYVTLSNRAYMYFTEMGYHFEPTQEEIESYYEAHRADIPSSGEKTVNIRHILLLPEQAEIAADGTVTASEDDWNRCLTQAKNLVEKWQKRVKSTRYAQFAVVDVAESRFSEFAKDNSADEGSRSNGGLYVNLSQGQLLPELDAWCFDDARLHGDYEIIRSACGYHIVFFSAATEDWYAAAEKGLRRQYYQNLADQALAAHPVSVDYSAIKLSRAEHNGSHITPADLLYPDVAHERFPDMPLYLQQDYPDAPYGDYQLRTHGCGITTLAMVASYLADDELTPVELAARYGYYCGPRGTEQVLFDDTPAEMGFYFKKRAGSWSEVAEAVRSGHVVVSLQWAGYWTRGGHYLAIIGETDEETYVVRDSNLINYKRIPAHLKDSHTRGSITKDCHGYWIYEKKVTSIPACVRCGEEGAATAPAILFQSDYHCQKCLTAMARRGDFLDHLVP
ncbi:MAG: C39 family peptidase [Faecousia sp.]